MIHPPKLRLVGRSVNIDQMDPETMARFYAASDDPEVEWSLGIVSAARTRAQQTYLYKGYEQGRAGFNLAADPDWQRPDGSYGSRHMVQETGYAYALDLRLLDGYTWTEAHRALDGYGLRFPVPGESWHCQGLHSFESGRPVYWPILSHELHTRESDAIDVWQARIGVHSSTGERADETYLSPAAGWNKVAEFVADCRRLVLRPGDNGPAVKLLQRCLNNHNVSVPYHRRLRWPVLVLDGEFGPQTGRAVSEFQTDSGLVVDRVVGPATWAALIDDPGAMRPGA